MAAGESPTRVGELTYILLGTGRLNARTHPVWHGNGKQRDLAPRVWPVTARRDWLRPLRLVSWQPLRTPTLDAAQGGNEAGTPSSSGGFLAKRLGVVPKDTELPPGIEAPLAANLLLMGSDV